MTVVLYGSCPDCGRSTGLAGVLCYSNATTPIAEAAGNRTSPDVRVVACTCGSRRRPA